MLTLLISIFVGTGNVCTLKQVWEASEEKSSESGIGALLAALINEPQLIHGYSEVAIIARIVRKFLGNLPLSTSLWTVQKWVERTQKNRKRPNPNTLRRKGVKSPFI